MAAEEKLALPSADFFSAVKYHVVGSLQDQVRQLMLFENEPREADYKTGMIWSPEIRLKLNSLS